MALATAAAACVGLTLGSYARWRGPRAFEAREIEVSPARWPANMDGFRVALVADLHLGHFGARPWTCPALDAAVECIGSRGPNMLVLAGDLGYHDWDADSLAAAASRFDAPARVAVLGNHDYALGKEKADELRRRLQSAGYTVLINEVAALNLAPGKLWIAGLGGMWPDRPDVPRVLSRLPEHAAPAILVSHKPDHARWIPSGRIDLVLSGHTHGGQISLPGLRKRTLRRFAHSRFDRGLYDVAGTPVVVTKGLGMTGYHARFRARPEVVFVTLRGDRHFARTGQ